MSQGKRATTIEEFEAILEIAWPSDDSDDQSNPPAYHPRPTDIIITPHAKSGTTWLQQIAHGLRTRGSMAFGEITEVVPWIGVVHHFGWDINAEQVAEPRLFKSHATWERVPQGARYVVSIRHPYDVFVSQFRFDEGWFFEPNSISLEAYAEWAFSDADAKRPYYFTHLISWWSQRKRDDLLLLCYEEMKLDLAKTIRQLARFMQIDLDNELFEIVLRQSSREFMLAHKNHFDDRHVRRLTEQEAGLPAGDAHKVTKGSRDDRRYQLPARTKEILDELWGQHIEAEFGFANYEALRQALRAPQ
ncbi:MAG: sulfotransferase domain-containing protein [Chloroflexota bacterium]